MWKAIKEILLKKACFHKWELVKEEKFGLYYHYIYICQKCGEITTLKPFDKVLVRDNNEQKWTIDYFSFADKEQVYPFICVGHYVSQCIPYEENEHLLGTTNDCDEYYKTW